MRHNFPANSRIAANRQAITASPVIKSKLTYKRSVFMKRMGIFFAGLILFGLMTNFSLAAQDNDWAYQFGQELFWEALRDANRIPYKISNETGKDIQEIYISRSDFVNWGQNQWTAQELFSSGYYIDAKSDDVGSYDIMLVATDGWSYIKEHVRIITDVEIKFTASDRNKKQF
jgi:hypothetical protein